MVAATQKRKMLCKTRRGNLVITVCRSLSLFFKIHLAAFAARDQIFKAGNYGGSRGVARILLKGVLNLVSLTRPFLQLVGCIMLTSLATF